MSSNQSIDFQFGAIMDFFSGFATNLLSYFGPLALSLFVWVMETWTGIFRQTTRTIYAILDSFKSDVIIFYQQSNMFYPSIEKGRTFRKFMIGDAKWSYNVTKQRFTNLDTSIGEFGEYSIAFLGASVSCNLDDSSQFLGDLSEWILDQTIWSNSKEIPFQVLVGAWAYCHNVSLYYNYPGHTFTVMTMDGDEKTFDLQTGQEHIDELRLPPSPAVDVSSDSESSLEDGEIPMPPPPSPPPPSHASDSKED